MHLGLSGVCAFRCAPELVAGRLCCRFGVAASWLILLISSKIGLVASLLGPCKVQTSHLPCRLGQMQSHCHCHCACNARLIRAAADVEASLG